MDAYENLANAIIVQAAKDYREALKQLAVIETDRMARGEKTDCEHFFRSRWHRTLTTVDGEFLIRKLRESNGMKSIPQT